jgi:predicted acylesterase/phospholipase RssA/CRP-like cAMP-binding protein
MMDEILRAQEKLSILDQIPLFTDLLKTQKRLIASSSQIVEYKKGDIVYRQNTPPDAFYCVVTGRLKAYAIANGVEAGLDHFIRGKYFGTISILTGEPHSVTVQALNDSVLLKIPREPFEKILKRIPRLAVHFSQTLSRQIKLKDSAKRTVFESTIISAFGASGRVGTSIYILNLAVSLAMQTGKSVALVKLSKTSDCPAHRETDSRFFDPAAAARNISKGRFGIDVISAPGYQKQIAPLLTYLTCDYHYVLVDLPSDADEITMEVLRQSDIVHLLSASDKDSLSFTANIIKELKIGPEALNYKIKIITSEHGKIPPIDFAKRRDILEADIFATLPDDEDAGDMNCPVILASPDCEYSRMIRRMSRQIGGCLVGLALGAGAAQGFAHIGILRVIEREKIAVDVLSGTSIGAVIAAMWASGLKADDIERSFLRFKNKMAALRLVDLVFPKKGLIGGREIRRFLSSILGKKTFRDLKLPLKIVTCDIATREEVVVEEGLIIDAVMASVSIPGMFAPVTINGRLLVDGGIINPLPCNTLMKYGAAKIIAVNALPGPEDVRKFKKKDFNIFDMIVRNIQASEYLLAEASCQGADIAMHPVLAGVDWYEIYEVGRIIQKGEEEAMRYLSRLKELASAR